MEAIDNIGVFRSSVWPAVLRTALEGLSGLPHLDKKTCYGQTVFFRSGDTTTPLGGAVNLALEKDLKNHSAVCVP